MVPPTVKVVFLIQLNLSGNTLTNMPEMFLFHGNSKSNEDLPSHKIGFEKSMQRFA